MMKFSQPLPLSLYIHYPWCVQKCPYCDFNSHDLNPNVDAQEQEKRYLAAIIKQMEATLPMVWGRPIQTIFFGGGTPSLMSVEGLDWLMSQLRALLGFSADIEVTLEANPGTVDEAKFVGFRQAGINRLSMGIQSFNADHLNALGRIHNDHQAWSAIEAAKLAGFENVNLDLMFALPGQTLEQALADVEKAISAQPNHLSHYQLTLEPNTPFYRQPPILPDEDLAWDMQQACQQRMAEAGYEHYEVSAFAKPGKQSRHNLNYWTFGDYIGLGAGAHGKLTLPQTAEIWRSQMPASPGGYMHLLENPAVDTTRPGGLANYGRWQTVAENEVAFEFMLNALRLQQGFELDLFAARTGLPLERIKSKLAQMEFENWTICANNRLELTNQGQKYLNTLIELFLE